MQKSLLFVNKKEMLLYNINNTIKHKQCLFLLSEISEKIFKNEMNNIINYSMFKCIVNIPKNHLQQFHHN